MLLGEGRGGKEEKKWGLFNTDPKMLFHWNRIEVDGSIVGSIKYGKLPVSANSDLFFYLV